MEGVANLEAVISPHQFVDGKIRDADLLDYH